jgi:predicted transcriptional regulator
VSRPQLVYDKGKCYICDMTKLAEEILDRIESWPEQARAELIQSLLEIEEKHVGIYRLTDDERAAVRRGLEEMRQGKFASEERVAAIFNRYR